jgi:hypothetical protein
MSPRRHARALATRTLPGSSTRGIASVALFAAVQLADGTLTLEGIARFGPAVESNPILGLLIVTLGAGTTLLAAKGIAVLLATALHSAGWHLALALLTIVYVFGAVIPWTSLLFM